MATSRRIDSAFFDQKWVDDLVAAGGSQYVLLFLYLVITRTNPVGLFEVNPRLWNFKLNPPRPFTGEDVFTVFGKRVRRVEGHPDKGIIVGFCDYQRNFSQQSKQWDWVVKDLQAVGLTYEDLLRFSEESEEAQMEFDMGLPPKPLKHRERAKAEPPQRCVVPPKVEWVRDYCSTRNNGIDAQEFVDFYEQKGWKVGKNRMEDWQAAVRTWEARRKAEGVAKPKDSPTPVRNVASVRRKF